MALPLYLAMTAGEFTACSSFPEKTAWMACHFSPYGTGLSNCPGTLPKGSMVILNDRTPIHGHDPERIVNQLQEIAEKFQCSSVLLDFQRPGIEETALLAKAIMEGVSFPVGVSDLYAKELDCPVFLPPAPLHSPLAEYISPWQGREIWLEAALDSEIITVTPEGAAFTPLPYGECPEGCHLDAVLHCRYTIEAQENARFTLHRTMPELHALLQEAETLGVTQAVGLWQELGAT